MQIKITVKEARKIAKTNLKEIEDYLKKQEENFVQHMMKQKVFVFFGRCYTREEAQKKYDHCGGDLNYSPRQEDILVVSRHKYIADKLLKTCNAIDNNSSLISLEDEDIRYLLHK